MSVETGSNFSVEQLRKLASSPKQASEQVLPLLATLESDDEELRAWACDALQVIESLPVELAPQLAALCRHPQAPVALWSSKLMVRLGKAAAEYQSALAHSLANHPDLYVRQEAAAALGKIDGLHDDTKDMLRAAAASDDPRLSRLASEALRRQQAT